jgi:hypothetical protein
VSGRPRAAFPKPFNYSEDGINGDTEWDYDFQCYFLYQHRSELYHWIDFRCEQMVAGTFWNSLLSWPESLMIQNDTFNVQNTTSGFLILKSNESVCGLVYQLMPCTFHKMSNNYAVSNTT